MGFSLDWENRTTGQKVAFVASVIVIICALACLIANIVISVNADQQNWFANSLQQKIMFFVMRSYAIIFALLVIVAEFYQIEMLQKYVKAYQFYFVRGAQQMFVGLMTVAGDFAPPGNDNAARAIAGIGWSLVALGALHLFLACACFKEYGKVTAKSDADPAATPAVGAGAPPMAGGAAPTPMADAGTMGGNYGGTQGSAYRI